jgi:predicted nucleic acid-binding protein
MRYLLDATVLIDHNRGRPTAVALVQQLFSEPNDLLVCDAIVAEVLSAGSDQQFAVLTTMIDALEYVATHPEAARWAGQSRRRLGRTGHRRLGDALIAGVAWFHDAVVVTRNPGDFEIQGVRVLGYD